MPVEFSGKSLFQLSLNIANHKAGSDGRDSPLRFIGWHPPPPVSSWASAWSRSSCRDGTTFWIRTSTCKPLHFTSVAARLLVQCCIRLRCQHDAPIPRRRVLPALRETNVRKLGRTVGRNVDRVHCDLDDSDPYRLPSLRTEASPEESPFAYQRVSDGVRNEE